jgi:hypothetical protein
VQTDVVVDDGGFVAEVVDEIIAPEVPQEEVFVDPIDEGFNQEFEP